MKDETRLWIDYAEENLASAEILLQSRLYNPTLQNAQQAIEKYLKAYIIEFGLGLPKTHSIATLKNLIEDHGTPLPITEDAVDLIDSIYLTSKYPMGSVLPDYSPDEHLCRECLTIIYEIRDSILGTLKKR